MSSLELRIPPAALVAAAAALMWLAAWMLPSLRLVVPGHILIAAALALLGAIVVALGLIEFRRAHTTVNPLRPDAASSLVVNGVYARTRNPMYLGFTIVLLAWAVCLSHPVSLLVLPFFIAYMNRFQIIPEERALQSAFANDFDRYRERVRRWL